MTRYKVKVKSELLIFGNPFSKAISSAIYNWS